MLARSAVGRSARGVALRRAPLVAARPLAASRSFAAPAMAPAVAPAVGQATGGGAPLALFDNPSTNNKAGACCGEMGPRMRCATRRLARAAAARAAATLELFCCSALVRAALTL